MYSQLDSVLSLCLFDMYPVHFDFPATPFFVPEVTILLLAREVAKSDYDSLVTSKLNEGYRSLPSKRIQLRYTLHSSRRTVSRPPHGVEQS